MVGTKFLVFSDTTFIGLRETDIRSGAALDRMRSAIASAGYDVVPDPTEVYASLGAEAVLENDDGCRFDLFVRHVGGELVFSEGMRRRSEEFVESWPIDARMLDG